MEKSFEREVLDRLTKIETKLDDYNMIKNKTDDAYNLSKTNSKQIEELQEKIKWLSRTIIGAFITGIIGLLFAFIQISMK